ncbi:hypothetical protein DP73_19665 [Desulfosporosinus sp. HMP52]|nr:hypothetical protein DP73_19665 [Desulfosporosinus sp. HMP52]
MLTLSFPPDNIGEEYGSFTRLRGFRVHAINPIYPPFKNDFKNSHEIHSFIIANYMPILWLDKYKFANPLFTILALFSVHFTAFPLDFSLIITSLAETLRSNLQLNSILSYTNTIIQVTKDFSQSFMTYESYYCFATLQVLSRSNIIKPQVRIA